MHTLRLISGLCLLLISITGFCSEQGSVNRCQTIKNKIAYYTDKRRQGGNSSAMRGWRKNRNRYNDLYFKYNCKAHAGKLK